VAPAVDAWSNLEWFMATLAIPIWEFVLRGSVVYIFLLVLLLVLSNAVQNSMNGGDNSLVEGLISALTLVALNYLVGIATSRSKRLEAFIEGRPEVLVHNGGLYPHVLVRAQLSRHELDIAILPKHTSGRS
jgi:uncharacterized membrane protein YcaP (DUF421 family)